MTEIALATHGLSVGYRQRNTQLALLKDLNLTLEKGKLVCFMGPNGIGKSTLIRTLAGLQAPLAGSTSPIDARAVSVVLTDRISAQHMSVAELVAFGRYPYLDWALRWKETDRTHFQNCIDAVRIRPLLDKKLYELSDGQMQMVMIARALVQETPLMLLDEPTAHLDLNNRLEVMNLLRRLARTSQKAILVATHELDLALQTADQIWLATGQQSIVSGIPEDLVLNGTFDEIFQFKGFDLKTGRVHHEAYQKKQVAVQGEGYALLWTKNALERNGYEVVAEAESFIVVEDDGWIKDGVRFGSLEKLLEHLGTR